MKYAVNGAPLVADTAGSRIITGAHLSIPVAPLRITTTVADEQISAVQGCVSLSSGGVTETYSMLSTEASKTADGSLALAKALDIRKWVAVTNTRSLAASSDGSTVSIDIGVGLTHAAGVAHKSSKVSLKVEWGSESVTSPEFFMCANCTAPFYVGTITLNLADLTANLDTSRVVGLAEGENCPVEDSGDDDDPDPPKPEPGTGSVKVKAPETYCSATAGSCHAGDYYPLLWDSAEKVVEYDETTTTANAALISASIGSADSESTRDYIVTPDGVTYWEDTDYVPSSVREISVRLMEDHLTGKKLWAMGYGHTGETGCVYRATTIIDKASEKRLSSLSEQRNFPAPGNIVADSACNIPKPSYHIVDNRRGVVLVSDEISCSLETIACGGGHEYFKFSGSRGGVSFECRTRIFEAPYLSEYVGGCGGLAEYLRVNGWLPVASPGGWSCITDELGMQYTDDTSPEIGEVRGTGFSAYHYVFSIDGGLYTVPNSATVGYVYEFVRAWRASECLAAGVTPPVVFTGSSPDRYYMSEDDANSGNVANGFAILRKGSSRFSIDFAGATYQRIDTPPETVETIDEEFE